MPLESVTIAGTVVDPCLVDTAAVVIQHGRSAVSDGPQAGTAVLALIVPTMPAWAVGDPITVNADGAVRFTGRISDVHLTHLPAEQGPEAVLELTCLGPVADLGRRDVGDTPWPKQRSADRARDILTAAGLPYQVEGDPSIQVNPRDVDKRRALDLLGELAEDVGAAVFDTPAGTVVFQHYSSRAQGWAYRLWREAPGIWSEQDQWFPDWNATAQVSPSAPVPVILPCDTVAWEPTWTTTDAQVINHVTIGYGVPAPGAEPAPLTATHPASITRYGTHHYGNDTQLADSGSAAVRAGLILDRHAVPRWAMSGVDTYPNDMPAPLRAQVLALTCGNRVTIPDLPQPAPAYVATFVVEGWTHTLTPGLDVLTLALSDPMHSYAGIIWAALDPAGRWQDCPPALQWFDALTDPTRKAP